MDTDDERRKRWIAYCRRQEEDGDRREPFPSDLVDLRCGAKNRAGKPCQQRALYSNGRCKFHGGMATGPTSEAGKEQSRINGRKGGRPRKGISSSETPPSIPVQALPNAQGSEPKPLEESAMSIDDHMLLKDVLVSESAPRRCADCRNLSADWRCAAAGRGEIEGGASYRPAVGEQRTCKAFKHWKTGG